MTPPPVTPPTSTGEDPPFRTIRRLTAFLTRHELDWQTVGIAAGIVLVVVLTFVIPDEGGIGCSSASTRRPSDDRSTTTRPG